MNYREAFNIFDRENPEVYTLFKSFCFEVLNRGKQKYSARAIMERLRWELDLNPRGSDIYKINDHTIPYYARKFLAEPPQHGSFFEIRKLHQK